MSRNEMLDILKKYKMQYGEQFCITALGVFGSIARNQSTAVSDLDICIKKNTELFSAGAYQRRD